MTRLSFRKFYEATDIFGFDREKKEEVPAELNNRPVDQFDVELMMEFLSKKKLDALEVKQPFPNVLQWGNQPGAVKLEVGPTYKFHIKKLGIDKQGNPRWANKNLFQLNRNGYGGYEDAVAQEVFEKVRSAAQSNIESPVEDYKDLSNLVENLYNKLRRTSKTIFLPEGVKKLHDDAYILTFGVRAQGLEARDHNRIEQNQTLVTYDRSQGTIRATNYNLLSKTGRGHEFKINLNDLDCYFFPTQSRDEITEVIAVHLKYY